MILYRTMLAFSDDQGLKRLAAGPDDVAALPGGGHAFADMMGRFDEEERKNPDYQMFKDELADHEYSYTGERVGCLSLEEVDQDAALRDALTRAERSF